MSVTYRLDVDDAGNAIGELENLFRDASARVTYVSDERIQVTLPVVKVRLFAIFFAWIEEQTYYDLDAAKFNADKNCIDITC